MFVNWHGSENQGVNISSISNVDIIARLTINLIELDRPQESFLRLCHFGDVDIISNPVAKDYTISVTIDSTGRSIGRLNVRTCPYS